MDETEKWVNETTELIKIRLKQLVTKDNGLVKDTLWKNFGNKRIRIEISVEDK